MAIGWRFWINDASGYVKHGSTVASAGDYRTKNNWSMVARNAANNGDVPLLKVDSSDNIELGSESTGVVNTRVRGTQTASMFAGAGLADYVIVYGSTGIDIGAGGSTRFKVRSAANSTALPIIGDSSANSPWGSDGDSVITMASANKTLTAAEYSKKILIFTGTLGAPRTVTLPEPAEGEGYTKELINEIDEADNFITFTIGSGKTLQLIYTGGIRRAHVAVTSDGIYVTGCVSPAELSTLSNT